MLICQCSDINRCTQTIPDDHADAAPHRLRLALDHCSLTSDVKQQLPSRGVMYYKLYTEVLHAAGQACMQASLPDQLHHPCRHRTLAQYSPSQIQLVTQCRSQYWDKSWQHQPIPATGRGKTASDIRNTPLLLQHIICSHEHGLVVKMRQAETLAWPMPIQAYQAFGRILLQVHGTAA